MQNKFLLFKSPSLWPLFPQPQETKTQDKEDRGMGVGERQLCFHRQSEGKKDQGKESEGRGHGPVGARVEETAKCKRPQVPDDNHPGAHRRAEPPNVPDERDTLTRRTGLASKQTPTHSLIHQYGLTLTCQTGGPPQSLSSFPGAQRPPSFPSVVGEGGGHQCWRPCWEKVLQPPAPPNPPRPP